MREEVFVRLRDRFSTQYAVGTGNSLPPRQVWSCWKLLLECLLHKAEQEIRQSLHDSRPLSNPRFRNAFINDLDGLALQYQGVDMEFRLGNQRRLQSFLCFRCSVAIVQQRVRTDVLRWRIRPDLTDLWMRTIPQSTSFRKLKFLVDVQRGWNSEASPIFRQYEHFFYARTDRQSQPRANVCHQNRIKVLVDPCVSERIRLQFMRYLWVYVLVQDS